jgi:hypothetical protein
MVTENLSLKSRRQLRHEAAEQALVHARELERTTDEILALVQAREHAPRSVELEVEGRRQRLPPELAPGAARKLADYQERETRSRLEAIERELQARGVKNDDVAGRLAELRAQALAGYEQAGRALDQVTRQHAAEGMERMEMLLGSPVTGATSRR